MTAPPAADTTAAPGDAVQPTAVAESVAAVIRDRIVKGDLEPGARLVERTLSAELNVSRTPIREALKLLHADGLIHISRNRGAQVTVYQADEAIQLFDVIAVLEGLAAERLAERIDAATLDRLEALHAKMLACHRSGEHADYFDLNSEIHDFIVENSGNPVIHDSHRRLIARARRGRFLAIMDPARLRQAVDEHEQLMQALRRRDPPAAAGIWRIHLDHTSQTVARVLRGESLTTMASSA